MFELGFWVAGTKAWETGYIYVQNSGERESDLPSWLMYTAVEVRMQERRDQRKVVQDARRDQKEA